MPGSSVGTSLTSGRGAIVIAGDRGMQVENCTTAIQNNNHFRVSLYAGEIIVIVSCNVIPGCA